ncbi:uncharacterized protein LOC123673068 [Harmonia axyridis]|uniref:uncharacterized protein LOC123673068 n=1 Tax=Harmonia axyridis TaxID=115357 RepID=UPI001E27989E|nr:uncharacterized protein LOC123673068 [Harmonia axyridis]
MGFFEEISHNYGPETTKELKLWSTNNRKLAAALNRRIFLLECKRQGLIPKHITSNVKSIMGLFEYNNQRLNRKIREFNDSTSKKIINLELCQVNHKIKRLELLNTQIRQSLQHLPEYMLIQYQDRLKCSFNKEFHKIKMTNLKKINNLKTTSIPNVTTQDRWIKNLSDKEIPNTVKSLLSLGSKFSVTTTKKDINIDRIIADTEYILEAIPDGRKNVQRAKVTNAVTNYIHRPIEENSLIQKWYKDTKWFLKENNDLIILNSDKGAVTVVMNEKMYNEKIQSILESKDFKRLPRDPTQTLQTKCNKYIDKLGELKYITKEQMKQMKTYNSVAPRIYGNPKVHKDGYPMRPIISSINSPMNSLSKFIADILKTAYDEENQYYVKDTFHFATTVNNFKLPENYTLISLDFINLFGNLDKNDIIEVLKQKWDIIKEHTNINMELFMEIILFILNNNYCVFKEKYYLQIFGCAMGSKLSPRLAQYVMDHLVKSCVEKLPFNIPILKKFVDDLLLTVPKTHIQTTLKCFNSYSKNLQFTLEVENLEQCVPFLDTKVQRQDDVIKLKWHRKETHSNKMIHYNSDHNINIKINMIKQMKNRIRRICHESYIQEGIQNLLEILRQNGYPYGMLKKLLYASDTTEAPQLIRSEEVTEEIHYASYPNIHGLTKKLINIFKHEKVKIAIYNKKTVGNLYTKLKDPIQTLLKSNVVYEVKCEDCEKIYIGHTSQWLKSRLALHKSDIAKHPDRCALATHAFNLNHKINFEEAKVLKTEKNYKKRLILEMIEINKQENIINKKTDTNKLSAIYGYLLEKSEENIYFFDGPVDE